MKNPEAQQFASQWLDNEWTIVALKALIASRPTWYQPFETLRGMSTPPPRPAGPAGALGHGVVPPERIDLGDIEIRRWLPEDTAARYAAVTASYAELNAWMSWANQPVSWEQQRAYGESAAASWPGPDGGCGFGIFDRDAAVLGAVGLEDRLEPHALEIGYWCHSRHTGRGIITRAAKAVTEVALSLPCIERVEIHCDAANVRSAAIPRRLGYRLDRIEARPKAAPAETGRAMIWIMDAH